MNEKTERNHSRAADKAQVSVALPKVLLEDLGRLAKKDIRNRNNYIVKILSEEVKRELEKEQES